MASPITREASVPRKTETSPDQRDAFAAPIAERVVALLSERLQHPILAKEWMDSKEAGEYLGLHHITLLGYRKAGTGPRWHQAGTKIIRYKKCDLDAWLCSGRAEVA